MRLQCYRELGNRNGAMLGSPEDLEGEDQTGVELAGCRAKEGFILHFLNELQLKSQALRVCRCSSPVYLFCSSFFLFFRNLSTIHNLATNTMQMEQSMHNSTFKFVLI